MRTHFPRGGVAPDGRKSVFELLTTSFHDRLTETRIYRPGYASGHGLGELMEARVAPAQRRKFLSDIQDAVSHIQAIVDRLLELAALEKRRGLSERCPVKLAAVAAEAVEALTDLPLAIHKLLKSLTQLHAYKSPSN